jgi:hypothetical protein
VPVPQDTEDTVQRSPIVAQWPPACQICLCSVAGAVVIGRLTMWAASGTTYAATCVRAGGRARLYVGSVSGGKAGAERTARGGSQAAHEWTRGIRIPAYGEERRASRW